jgi:hypothetical protein
MRCSQHGKDLIAVCTWCGKQMCKLCIKKTDGKKAYCAQCVAQIGDMLQKKQIETIRKEDAAEKKQTTDYFNFSGLKRP